MSQQSNPPHPLTPDTPRSHTDRVQADLAWDPPEQLGSLVKAALDAKESTDDHS